MRKHRTSENKIWRPAAIAKKRNLLKASLFPGLIAAGKLSREALAAFTRPVVPYYRTWGRHSHEASAGACGPAHPKAPIPRETPPPNRDGKNLAEERESRPGPAPKMVGGANSPAGLVVWARTGDDITCCPPPLPGKRRQLVETFPAKKIVGRTGRGWAEQRFLAWRLYGLRSRGRCLKILPPPKNWDGPGQKFYRRQPNRRVGLVFEVP